MDGKPRVGESTMGDRYATKLALNWLGSELTIELQNQREDHNGLCKLNHNELGNIQNVVQNVRN